MRHARSASLVAIAALCALPSVAGAAQTVQPGAYHETGGFACTLNFIYDGGGGPYAGTAAHCVSSIGETTFDADGDPIGTVAAIGDEDATATDWALIRIQGAALSRISAQVEGHPGTPRGVASQGETNAADQLLSSGHGLVFGLLPATRSGRPALLTYDDANIYQALGLFIFGDSGGPVVHAPTGKALGIVSRLCIDICEQEGATVSGIIAQAAAKGFGIALRTA